MFSRVADNANIDVISQINFSNPAAGTQKQIEIDDERKTRIFMEKRISQEVAIDNLGDEFKGYVGGSIPFHRQMNPISQIV